MASGHDVIVVGAGSAGAVVALRLAERGRRVLLLEAGPDFPGAVPEPLATDLRIPVAEYDWGYISEGDREILLPRGKVVGGSSQTNSVAAVRWQPADLDAWGFPEWTYEACLPAMCRVEEDVDYGDRPYHGDSGLIRVERTRADEAAPVNAALFEACVAAGFAPCLDQNEPGATGVGPQPFNLADGARHSTLVTYVRAARALPAFELRPETLVDRVVLERGRATGVALAGGEEIRADEVIVCAGAYASPALLMRSGIGPAGHLREAGVEPLADLPVGDGLQDHPAMGLPAIAADESDLGNTLRERFMIRASLSGRHGQEDVHVFGPIAKDASRTPMPPSSYVIAVMGVKPRSRGTVRLRSRDPGDPPRITLNYFAEPADLDALADSLLLIEGLLAQPALAKLTSDVPWKPSLMAPAELRQTLRVAAQTDHHPTGTCPIGAVLDPHLRVHGVEGLRVCDASVMPETPRANTNLPTMAIAERFAELLDAER